MKTKQTLLLLTAAALLASCAGGEITLRVPFPKALLQGRISANFPIQVPIFPTAEA